MITAKNRAVKPFRRSCVVVDHTQHYSNSFVAYYTTRNVDLEEQFLLLSDVPGRQQQRVHLRNVDQGVGEPHAEC